MGKDWQCPCSLCKPFNVFGDAYSSIPLRGALTLRCGTSQEAVRKKKLGRVSRKEVYPGALLCCFLNLFSTAKSDLSIQHPLATLCIPFSLSHAP
ncbi:mCG142589, isoform CRA_b [Mus musculus]|nr:mCG142589, isoform CRA_b [Mus musculus]